MKTDELREMYLSFFEGKDCVRRPSDVLVPRDDATVLFTPAGMNQFKNQFLGIGKLEFTRATTSQKCLRTGDISNVGVTAYHHTFFEMLGNFSFGDYFKKEAIHWAWEFLTDKKWLGLDPELLSVTVYLDDDEAYNIWHDEIKLPANRIRRDDEHENFWPAGAPSQGPDGVCGPCSEIFYHPPGAKSEVEIWNLVFTQFNRVGSPPDNLRPLPKKNIDTGMGLERCASVLQGVLSNFEIDILKPLCQRAGEVVGANYSFDAPEGRALRRIADHVRAVTFCIHEGVNPGTEKQSYVVRQLLRRAQLEGYMLGRTDPFLHELVPDVVNAMKVPYPELQQTLETVTDVINKEETQFLEVIDRGLSRFERAVGQAKKEGRKVISGEDAFDLHQTEGFFVELTEAMAARNDMSVDVDRFKEMMEEHRKRSGSGAFVDAVMVEGPLDAIRNESGDTVFLGYDETHGAGKIVGLVQQQDVVDTLQADGEGAVSIVILDQTPFYGEAGGQVGDTGTLKGANGEFEVVDTQRNGNLILHLGHLKGGEFKTGETLNAVVADERRSGIRRAHSATHLLHHALHKTVGENATQRGSKVEQDALRFDFAHKQALTSAEIQQVETIINERIAAGATVDTELMALEDAREKGAMALFGEKYPDKVRVVSMGDFSVELCGGTHLKNTGQVGFCKIVSEEPVAKGVRRISALTGPRALQRIRETEDLLNELVGIIKSSRADELPQRVRALQDELKETKRELARMASESVSGAVDDLIANADVVDGVTIVSYQPENATRDALRDLADEIRSKAEPAAIIVAAEIDGKVALTAAVSKELIKRGVKASDCIKVAAKVAGGGGGGRPDLAEAGGKNPEKIPDALEAGAKYYREALEG